MMFGLTDAEIKLIWQWFNAIQDIAPQYLSKADYTLALRICCYLGFPTLSLDREKEKK